MSILGKIFGTDNQVGHISTQQAAEGMAVMYEQRESEYKYVDEDPATAALSQLGPLKKDLLTDTQTEYVTLIGQHIEASRERKGQVLYTPKPKF